MAQSGLCGVQALWAEYGRRRSDLLRNRLMEHYLPLVKSIAQRVRANLPREVELEDLVSAGVFGLMYAIEAYDPKRRVKFETYCVGRIRGAILDELRSWDWVPRLARVRAQKLVSATQELKLELGRTPSCDELASRLKVSRRELKKILRGGSLVRIMPLSGRNSQADAEEPEGPPNGQAVEEPQVVDREELRNLIAGELSRAEQLIIVLYYFEQMTMKEIGLTLDLSESRVSQMHSSVLARLQGYLAGRGGEHKAAA
jgi:RNA polymerase sigma factor for flagellar operon FliA